MSLHIPQQFSLNRHRHPAVPLPEPPHILDTGIDGWMCATSGQRYDQIVLDREPETERERIWVDEVLPTRLVPGGVILVAQSHDRAE